jgi:hypothetical protein
MRVDHMGPDTSPTWDLLFARLATIFSGAALITTITVVIIILIVVIKRNPTLGILIAGKPDPAVWRQLDKDLL